MAMTKSAVDAYSDPNQQTLHRISKLASVPAFVKDAAIGDEKQRTALPQTVFADPVNRKFPLHTKAATWLAQAYFTEARHLYGTQLAELVQGKITKAAAYWGIADDADTVRRSLEQQQAATPPELTDADYALVIKQGEQTVRDMPIHSEPNVKAAAAKLYNSRSKIPYEHRKVAARKILRKAAMLGVSMEPELTEYLTKATGLGSALPKQAAEEIVHRALMVPASNQRLKTATMKIAQTVAKWPGIPPADAMDKVASIIDRLDREQGFFRHYDEGVSTPEEICFALTEKSASTIRNSFVELTTGTIIPMEALHTLPLDKVAATIGDDFMRAVQSDTALAVDIEKFARVAATLPRDDALLLERALKSAGIMPARPTLDSISV